MHVLPIYTFTPTCSSSTDIMGYKLGGDWATVCPLPEFAYMASRQLLLSSCLVLKNKNSGGVSLSELDIQLL